MNRPLMFASVLGFAISAASGVLAQGGGTGGGSGGGSGTRPSAPIDAVPYGGGRPSVEVAPYGGYRQDYGAGNGSGRVQDFGPGSGTGQGRCRVVRVRECSRGDGDGGGPRCRIVERSQC